MGCIGFHFALTEADVLHLRSIKDERERLNCLWETIEGPNHINHPEFKAESDMAWDAIHRVLGNGMLTWYGGSYPLNHVILGGESLFDGDDYIIILKTPDQVRDIALALFLVFESEFRERYFAIDPEDYSFAIDEEDFEYTWYWFQGVRAFYEKVAKAGRYVIFTAYQ